MPIPSTIYNIYRNVTKKIVNARQEIAKIIGLLFLLLLVVGGFGFLLWYLGNTTCNHKGPCEVWNWLDYLGFS